MKVVYLLGEDFKDACYKLADKIYSSYKPDLVIGILTGGGVVGKEIMSRFKEIEFEPNYLELKIQRNLTKKKESNKVGKFLVKMPRSLTKLLINIEVLLLEMRSKVIKVNREVDEDLQSRLKAVLIEKDIKSVLLVDDCIDTGGTVLTLKNLITSIDNSIKVKTAVITVTHKRPIINPDFTLFNRTICRFPWSMEIKKTT